MVPTPTLTHLPPELEAAFDKRLDEGKIEFPSLPDVAGRVVHATFDPECDLGRLETIVQEDPHLAGQVLKMANSALFCPATPITSLRPALAQIGLGRARDVALMVSAESRTFMVEGYEDDIREIVQHGKATAVYAREVARSTRVDPGAAFCVGLLHDCGRPILIQALVDLKVILKVKLRQEIDLTRAAVREAGRSRHGDVGAQLLASWQLPAALVDAVRWHHDPSCVDDPETRGLAGVVAVADDLADGFCTAETLAKAAAIGLDEEAVDRLVARRAEFDELVAQL